MLILLDVIPDKLILQPRCLLLRQGNVLGSRLMTDLEPLPAVATFQYVHDHVGPDGRILAPAANPPRDSFIA